MDDRKLCKQLIEFHKISLTNCFSMMVMMQQQAENILNIFHYLPIMTDGGKKFMQQRTNLYKKWIDDLKKAMDQGYAQIEHFYDNKAMADLRDQTHKAFDTCMTHKNRMPEDVNALLGKLNHLYKKGCREFKKYVEDNRQQIQNYYKNINKTRTKAKS